MNESLLQFIWQHQYFNRQGLETTSGEQIVIINPGELNRNQGPDFKNAKIRIGPALWAGTVELHVLTWEWGKHGHQFDSNYTNVILHVVWEHHESANSLPVLELKDRVSKILLGHYEYLMQSPSFIPCAQGISSVNELTWVKWKETLLVERLLRKSLLVTACLEENNFHWEETCWWLLAKNFGYPVNAEAFESIARSLPLKILSRHHQQLQQLECLLLGQAGLLQADFNEDYPRLLKKEYNFLKKKYDLSPNRNPVHFLRMRPANFPTVRLAQLSALIHKCPAIFDEIKKLSSLNELRKLFRVSANDYWHYHYRLDELSGYQEKLLGAGMTENILINTVIPLLYSFGDHHGESQYREKAINWLESCPAESNQVIKRFRELNIMPCNAFDTQALLELKSQYCNARRCLDCEVGNSLLKNS